MEDNQAEWVASFQSARVLIVGDVFLDHYIFGDANRISPEAPVPVVTIDSERFVGGGAANVALNLVNLGAQVGMRGPIGCDAAGQTLIQLMQDQGIDLDPGLQRETIQTITKTRVIAQRQQICRIDKEEPYDHYAFDWALESICAILPQYDALILSDYAKGALSQATLTALIEAAQAQGLFIAMDPKPAHEVIHKDVDLLTPNRSEALKLAGLSTRPHAPYPLEAVCEAIWERYQPRTLVITMGAEGMVLSQEAKVISWIPAQVREVFDVSGAGDSVIATLTLSALSKLDWETCLHLANLAGGIVVGKLGTSSIHLHELIQAYQARS